MLANEPIISEKKPHKKNKNLKQVSKGEKSNSAMRMNSERKTIFGVTEKKNVKIVGAP